MDDQSANRESSGALNTILRRGVINYVAGLAAILAATYVLPASRFSFFLFFGGMAVFFVANIIMITAAMALEFAAARHGRSWL